MRIHFRLAALALTIASIALAAYGNVKAFFLIMAIALELYALTEINTDWQEKFHMKNISTLMKRAHTTSPTGIIAQFTAYLSLIGYFLS